MRGSTEGILTRMNRMYRMGISESFSFWISVLDLPSVFPSFRVSVISGCYRLGGTQVLLSPARITSNTSNHAVPGPRSWMPRPL